ncbi:MAG: aminoacyl-tRNA hydrolase [Chloroflexota bacterium]|nr:aminoacyl-tRNA hydrolase [Chloroflexota bacterium]
MRNRRLQSRAERWVVLGLGNPGAQYEGTRHNMGFRCVDLLAKECGVNLNERRKLAVLGLGRVAGKEAALAKPRTYVNRSGEAAAYLRQRFGAPLSHILVVLDDMDLPLGRLRIRHGGGSGGHNGLNSINKSLESQDYPRLRIGVGRPEADAIAHVLGGFTAAEQEAADAALAQAVEAVKAIIASGVDAAMNEYN